MNYEAEEAIVAAGRVEEGGNLKLRTKQFSLRIIKLYSALPKSAVAQVLGKQVLRSATSVGANYREAFRARSASEFLAKLGDCLKELEETLYWLELMAESDVLPTLRLVPLQSETNELLAIFTAIAKAKKDAPRSNGSALHNS